MSGSVERFDEKARGKFSRYGQTVVHRGELLRHPVYTRVLHWCVAILFILSLLSGFANAGIYDPQSVGGTHVIYVLHDITKPELYGGLPSNPVIPPSYTVWKWLAKPTGLFMAALGILAVFFHRVTVGPKVPQPEPEPVLTLHPDEVKAAREEKP